MGQSPVLDATQKIYRRYALSISLISEQADAEDIFFRARSEREVVRLVTLWYRRRGIEPPGEYPEICTLDEAQKLRALNLEHRAQTRSRVQAIGVTFLFLLALALSVWGIVFKTVPAINPRVKEEPRPLPTPAVDIRFVKGELLPISSPCSGEAQISSGPPGEVYLVLDIPFSTLGNLPHPASATLEGRSQRPLIGSVVVEAEHASRPDLTACYRMTSALRFPPEAKGAQAIFTVTVRPEVGSGGMSWATQELSIPSF